MLFCPTCSNILLTEKTLNDFRFFCKTCPYIFRVQKQFENKMKLERKEVDDVLGGEEAWRNVDNTEIQCKDANNCLNKRAYFMEIQIRSGDEPATLFYKCTACAYQWSEN